MDTLTDRKVCVTHILRILLRTGHKPKRDLGQDLTTGWSMRCRPRALAFLDGLERWVLVISIVLRTLPRLCLRLCLHLLFWFGCGLDLDGGGRLTGLLERQVLRVCHRLRLLRWTIFGVWIL